MRADKKLSKKQIGERIRKLREGQNYTRENLAEKAEITAKFLYEIETGRKGFSAEVLCYIAQALSVSCDYIMLGEEKEHQRIGEFDERMKLLDPGQMSKIQDILKILYDMCDAI